MNPPERRTIRARTTDGFHEADVDWPIQTEYPEFYTLQISPQLVGVEGIVFNEQFPKSHVIEHDGQLHYRDTVQVSNRFFPLLNRDA